MYGRRLLRVPGFLVADGAPPPLEGFFFKKYWCGGLAFPGTGLVARPPAEPNAHDTAQ